ncbi:sulfotransferase [Defluviimonas sp. D31]|uniref:sulfotransferase n=1 Tax=Defluviimonas sp. D31 TaxID=3083253 RepID=UPI00296FD10F|nr:sulfotransferase [Defluviimonas sp. D31]MDW4549326.1 sulfotransferase [Defluviimonas sp. D31]
MEKNGHPMVFVLGDSRTGTTSLHHFFKSAGYQSIHYYFDESGVKKPAHLDIDGNWQRLKRFIVDSPYNAFSDYPTRIFYRQLFREFPTARFILSRRDSLETWKQSMVRYFRREQVDIDIEALSAHYINLNREIRATAAIDGRSLLEICIDEDDDENSRHLRAFLNIDGDVTIRRLNAS